MPGRSSKSAAVRSRGWSRPASGCEWWGGQVPDKNKGRSGNAAAPKASSRSVFTLRMKPKLNSDVFRVVPGLRLDFAARPTRVTPWYESKKQYRKQLEAGKDELAEWQNVLYAGDQQSLLLVFQGLDTSGKDGAIKHVLSGVNPQGCQVFSFKAPSSEELEHDFLWRAHQRVPERGRIGVFNRSHYEDVVIARVAPEVLARQRIPARFLNPATLWTERFRDIVQFEDYHHRNGTQILKFFLHLSKEEQRHRLLARIDAPQKNWKMSVADLVVRRKWEAFQAAYADCLAATSTATAPWYVVPADDKRNARLIILEAILETLRALDLRYPESTDEHRRALAEVRRGLANESGDRSRARRRPPRKK